MGSELSHLNSQGQAHMVDIGSKSTTHREAVAQAFLQCSAKVLETIRNDAVPKGDIFSTARIAGIQAAKRTDSLIPLCHSLPLSSAQIDFDMSEQGIRINARVKTEAQTGVEMEALTAASIAGLTLYDMLKAIDKSLVLEDLKLLRKTGGKSGEWARRD